jgi:very-short-patch-repair endonuclease
MKLYKSSLKTVARELRKNMTPTEELIWFAVRKKKLFGIQFYRQKTLSSYIVDFYAPAVNLVIEIDGAHHLTEENRAQDQFRDAVLKELGLSVLRFSNSQVKNTFSKVIEQISITIQGACVEPHFEKGGSPCELCSPRRGGF